jgi:hypothetical protein
MGDDWGEHLLTNTGNVGIGTTPIKLMNGNVAIRP